MSILSFQNINLTVAGNKILDNVDWQIQHQSRIALVGRNGAGKSTLMRLIQGEITSDSGQVNNLNGLKIAGLMQELPKDLNEEKVYPFLVKDLGEKGIVLAEFHRLSKSSDLDALAKCQQKMDELHAWDYLPKIDTMASHLGINPEDQISSLSGGMKRRVLLAAALIAEPDLLLLDEPTNHLDIEAIEWLEAYLKNYRGSLLVVTHDRAFLNSVANLIVEIDRGKLYSYQCDYETYLDRKEARLLAEDKHNALFDKRLAEEEVWIRTGIKARRTRNEGRVRALKAMREQHKMRREQVDKVKNIKLDVNQSGFLVLEADKLNYQINERTLLKDFSLLLTKGDKLGIIGPNGCGKTTLVRLLLGELKGTGRLKRGSSLEIAYFDQLRSNLNENETLMKNVADGAEHVTINGKQKHVASYLKDFLFQPERFNQLVSTLSGGERNRLLLAKLLARPVNLLVMDEPTNDLDIETLELLEGLLIDYPGTLILISHDRAFINSVVTSVLVYEEEGVFNEYLGGYDEYKRLKKERVNVKDVPVKTAVKSKTPSNKLSFNEQRELQQLPKQIEKLEEKIIAIQEKMMAPEFYQKEASEITIISQELAASEKELAQLYARWETLEDKG
ncbi:MAG: ATP-binding cassette domain-containing protein [Proteobacteria bacterium]|nr:ATP-binding cassette domain-containing protein [Pseudomonadota bacterium]